MTDTTQGGMEGAAQGLVARLNGGPSWQPPADRAARVALVPCAGSGSRAGSPLPKQYVEVAGRSLVHWALEALLNTPGIDGALLVVSPGDTRHEQALPAALRQRVWISACGGESRAASVLNGLKALQELGLREQDWVLVHDAARCLLQPAWVQRLISACGQDEVGGLLALPLPDTLKRADAQGRVQATVPREGMWAAQTPQMFRLRHLHDCLQHALRAGVQVTDEASAVEHAGAYPLLVEGDPENFKVTYVSDFKRARSVLESRATLKETS